MILLFAITSFLGCHLVNAQISRSYEGASQATPSQTPASQFYAGFVTGDVITYPASYGSLFEYTNSAAPDRTEWDQRKAASNNRIYDERNSIIKRKK